MGAIYLQSLDAYAKAYGIGYVRYMDDFVFFAKSKHQLRKIVKKVYAILKSLGLKLAEDKTYIGKLSKGFVFLGYEIFSYGIQVAKTSCQRMIVKLYRHYVLQASKARLEQYLKRWLQWAKSGVGSISEPVKINKTLRPSLQLQIKLSLSGLSVFV